MRTSLARRTPFTLLLLTAVLALAPAAVAATAPTLTTGAVSAVGTSTATLNGTVNPQGSATTWQFAYGPSTSYGSLTPAVSAGSGTSDSQISATLIGLQPGTTYHYRLTATSSAGTTNGSDGIFTTTAAPAAVTGSATALSTSSATLSGTVDPNGQATSYDFEYGTSTSYGSATPATSAGSGSSADSVSATISGLQAGATYHFRLVATSSAGTSNGADATFVLSSPPSVSTSAASSVTATGARLNGTVDPNGEQTSWYFQYGKTSAYGSTTASTSAGSGSSTLAVSSTLSALAVQTVYHFRLVATSAAGTSYGADHTFGSPPPLPSVATGSAQSPTSTTVTLTGSVNPNGVATSWYFQYGPTTSYGGQSTITSAGSTSGAKTISAAITKLSPATTYHYRLVASSAGGTSDGNDVTFTTPVAITLAAESTVTVYGRADTLSGTAAGTASGTRVTVLAEPLGAHGFSALATVSTAANGSWSYQAKPTLETAYEVSTTSGTSAAITIAVRPAITVRRITGGRLLIRVVAGRTLSGRLVQLQRLRPLGGWATVTRAHLNSRSAAIVPLSVLPAGASTIRIAMSINEAGSGYLAGFSRTLPLTRS